MLQIREQLLRERAGEAALKREFEEALAKQLQEATSTAERAAPRHDEDKQDSAPNVTGAAGGGKKMSRHEMKAAKAAEIEAAAEARHQRGRDERAQERASRFADAAQSGERALLGKLPEKVPDGHSTGNPSTPGPACCNAACVSKATGARAGLQCRDCRVAVYCSKECQREHWPQHKRHCRRIRDKRTGTAAKGEPTKAASQMAATKAPATVPQEPMRAPDGGLCCVCMDAAQSHAFVPCGHLCACAGCAGEIMEGEKSECPLCRTPSVLATQIYGDTLSAAAPAAAPAAAAAAPAAAAAAAVPAASTAALAAPAAAVLPPAAAALARAPFPVRIAVLEQAYGLPAGKAGGLLARLKALELLVTGEEIGGTVPARVAALEALSGL